MKKESTEQYCQQDGNSESSYLGGKAMSHSMNVSCEPSSSLSVKPELTPFPRLLTQILATPRLKLRLVDDLGVDGSLWRGDGGVMADLDESEANDG